MNDKQTSVLARGGREARPDTRLPLAATVKNKKGAEHNTVYNRR